MVVNRPAAGMRKQIDGRVLSRSPTVEGSVNNLLVPNFTRNYRKCHFGQHASSVSTTYGTLEDCDTIHSTTVYTRIPFGASAGPSGHLRKAVNRKFLERKGELLSPAESCLASNGRFPGDRLSVTPGPPLCANTRAVD
ncbi:hypothetical protein H6P81_004350 [Aristolochia fimbriata]|uniref:Uncharacterized protein n=1 Tax=Aristolochia fimbriata TaxID=158543 RepID=A0AAV7FHZ5_ARIFI|nr:hypothetical protein H6P81_004350 [Aristolochia fimbriata]